MDPIDSKKIDRRNLFLLLLAMIIIIIILWLVSDYYMRNIMVSTLIIDSPTAFFNY